MDETLIIENLGPIKKLEIRPRPLTVIIGEQASGKSLVAQLLYFFRGLEGHLARIYNAELISQPKWHDVAIGKILHSLRGVWFAHFANGIASLHYTNVETGADWKIEIDGESFEVKVFETLVESLDKWVEAWRAGVDTMGEAQWDIFIPTERSLIARLMDTQPIVLYSDLQPMPLREFASLLNRASKIRQFPKAGLEENDLRSAARRILYDRSFAVQCQKNALGGEAAVTQKPAERWAWMVDSKVLPISAASSGQMEAWPFFEIAAFVDQHFDSVQARVYFEEPETHLHPRAQVEIMKVVAYLVNRGHNFVITTHSPFLLQVVDNMLQRFQNLKGQIPKGEEKWLNPEKVAAYCLRRDSEKSPEDIMDREETGLLDATELEKVSNELGAEFDELLYGAE